MKSFLRPTAVIFVGIGILARFLPHPANFTPIGGIALTSGAKLPKPWHYFLPLLIMLITDLFLGFHQTMIFVYGSLALSIYFANLILRRHQSYTAVAGVALINATIFFLITNLGVWLVTPLYPQTVAGLVSCFTMALPFFRNMLVADLIFGLTFMKLFSLAENYQPLVKFDLQAYQSIKLLLRKGI